jgi:hypothetical protein
MHLPKPLRCSEIGRDDLLTALIEKKLDPEKEDDVLRHLRVCPHCIYQVAKIIDAHDLASKPDQK